jgi:hypothetical protein
VSLRVFGNECCGRSDPAVAEEGGGESGRQPARFKTPPARTERGSTASSYKLRPPPTSSSSTEPLPRFLPTLRQRFTATMGLSVSKLLSGLFGKKEMRTWLHSRVIRSSLDSPVPVFCRNFDGTRLLMDRPGSLGHHDLTKLVVGRSRRCW